MQLFQVVIFISHYDSSCWFLSHPSFFKGEGAVFILKKKGMHCIMRSGIDHCCRMMHHYYDSFQFSAAESLRILFFFTHSSPCWFITLFLLMKTGARKGFTYFCCRLWLTFMMLMEMVAAVFLSAHKNCITILILFYINFFLICSSFKRKRYFASSYWCISASFKEKRGVGHTDSS